jgi:uncharacterized OB-fold protein
VSSFDGLAPHLPETRDLTRPFWDGLDAGEVRLQQCEACHLFQHPAARLCGTCGSRSLCWQSVSGAGEVYTYTVVHRTTSAAFKVFVPYVSAVVRMDEGPRFVSVVLEPPETVSIGIRVEPRIVQIGARRALMYQRAAKTTGK